MADHAEPDVLGSTAPGRPPTVPAAPVQEPGPLTDLAAAHAAALAMPGPRSHEPYHGRPVSWVAVSTIMAGFLCGGFALVFGPTWWVFWLGVGLAVLGGLIALATNIFEDWY